MAIIEITRKSSSFEDEVQSKALEFFNTHQTNGILFKETYVFIDYKPSHAIAVFSGKGVLEGRKIYVGKDN